VSDTADEILITVERSVDSAANLSVAEYLGFIRFRKAIGSLEFTNFGAALDRQCLELGYTTKENDNRLAGGHGEGLKIAALVLCRNQHRVKISTHHSYWNFGFRGNSKRHLYCQFSPASADRIKRQKMTHDARRKAGIARDLTANIWEDVSVIVGKVNQNGRPIIVEDFHEWMRVTIDLNRPSELVRTPHGDLILDEAYVGHLYVKGIHVPLAGTEGHRFRVGYNLVRGNLGRDRDRQRLMDGEQEARTVTLIWETAIKQQEEKVLPLYVSLLRYHPLWADVRLAEVMITEVTARKVWGALAAEARATGAFYYPEGYENPVSLRSSMTAGMSSD
jgi:hypothetical protein